MSFARVRHSVRPLIARLRMGGGHGHGPAPAGERPALFGEPPLPKGQSRPWEEWEAPIYFCILATIGISLYGGFFKENHNIRDWARDEAMERLRREKAGLPVEFGVNYAGVRYLKEKGAIDEEQAARLEAGEVWADVMFGAPSGWAGMSDEEKLASLATKGAEGKMA